MKLGDLLELPHHGEFPVIGKGEECGNLDMANLNVDVELAKRRAEVVKWLNSLFPEFNMDVEASEEELRARLLDGGVLCRILKRFKLASSEEIANGDCASMDKHLDYICSFVSAVEHIGLPGFRVPELEQGSMSAVIYCLWSLRHHLNCGSGGEKDPDSLVKFVGEARRKSKPIEIKRSKVLEFLREDINQSGQNYVDHREDKRNSFVDSRLKNALSVSPASSAPSTPLSHRSGHKFHEVFQLKQGRYCELPAAKISEMLKSDSLDNAPTQSLLTVIHEILEESIQRENGEISYSIACLLKKVIQEIERRISAQAEHIRNQNNLIKVREDKYESRIRVLETLANSSDEEKQMVTNQLQQLKEEKSRIEEKKKHAEDDLVRLMKEKGNCEKIISELMQNLETMKKSYEEQFHQQEIRAVDSQMELNRRLKEAESLLLESRKRRKEIEADAESKNQNWNKKEHVFQRFIDLHLRSVQDLRLSFDSIKHEVVGTEKRWFEDFNNLGEKLKVLTETANNYHSVLAQNRKLYNEVQELKGNIRVYCRIRPFLAGENIKQITIEHIGDNGELLLVNPSKQGKGQKVFNFNKVFGPSATQEEVFLDTRPLIRSVIDGYNVCIFAYGQTGSGKTYTMTGPIGACEKDWGVNYRALSDLFHISQSRRDAFMYEVVVQMVEIYNEQVRLAVPDASMHPVNSTSDVLELMQIGQTNRAVSATALNHRSSRSHSILTVHVRGMDLKNAATLHGSLHLVDLAGSERVDRSEVLGDRLKEAQHINKSLSALGDVIFALSQKSTHVPYRNSKLTQVLQSSLGGHAKTLMFVHINTDVGSYSETLSTLKFAERVSGVELGAARSQKDGKEVRDLMEQVSSLKDTIARKDEEIEQLKQLKAFRSPSLSKKAERHSNSPLRHYSSPTGISTLDGKVQQKSRLLSGKIMSNYKVTSKPENNPENVDHSECRSQKYPEDNKHQKEIFTLPTEGRTDQNSADVEILGIGDGDAEERLSDISDSVLSMGTETDGSISSVVELTLFPEEKKPTETSKSKPPSIPAKIPKAPPKKKEQNTMSQPKTKDVLKSSSSRKNISQVVMPSQSRLQKRWQ
ncbi:kinesin-4-like isoform X1 [Canna indica]|uniref:Kinesin-4-like isoform X1 n=1 Tax=Canna indica TaxID=4628 RepID=A0AAQ3KMK3_9LILI|nr:kinesin-4-like isoform X1 [Canna indica]